MHRHGDRQEQHGGSHYQQIETRWFGSQVIQIGGTDKGGGFTPTGQIRHMIRFPQKRMERWKFSGTHGTSLTIFRNDIVGQGYGVGGIGVVTDGSVLLQQVIKAGQWMIVAWNVDIITRFGSKVTYRESEFKSFHSC